MASVPSPTIYDIIQTGLLRYYCLILLIFGTIGNILNICIFTRPKLRLIPCSWYFLAASCSSLIALYMGAMTRLLTAYGYYPQTNLGSTIYCKIRTFLTYADLSLSIWFVIGACIDRWTSSCRSVKIRSFSSVKMAKRMIIITTLIIYLIYGQMLYCFNGVYVANTGICTPISNACDFGNAAALIFTYSIIPGALMLIFGLLTIRNVQQIRRNNARPLATITNNQNNKKQEKTTAQMTVMLFVQVICSIVLSLPVSIHKMYYVLTASQIKSTEQQQLESFINVLVLLITLANSSISFYIFTLTGQIFRRELKQIFGLKSATSSSQYNTTTQTN